MAYTMRPVDSALARGLQEFVQTLSPDCRMAEIGCYAGESTQIFLSKVAHMTCVDAWTNYLEVQEADNPVAMADMDHVEQMFDDAIAHDRDRVTKIKAKSLDAASQCPDGTFDLVYLDAGHSYTDCADDIRAWLPKVKDGGLIAGHDYDLTRPGVPQAVRELLGGPDALFRDTTWVKRVGTGVAADGPKPDESLNKYELKVLIGVPCGVTGGFRPFDQALLAMKTRPDVDVFYAMGGVLPGARNRIVREAIRRHAEYIWFLDSDQVFFPGDSSLPNRPTDLDALLARNVDAVVPLTPRSGNPFLPLAYSQLDSDGNYGAQRYLDGPEGGLVPIAAAGMGGLLIKTSCLLKMGVDGWFAFTHPPDKADDYNEDLNFYHRLRAVGVQLYCDLEVRFGHGVTLVAYIIRQGGAWVTVLADKDPVVAFPQPQHPLGINQMRKQNQTLLVGA